MADVEAVVVARLRSLGYAVRLQDFVTTARRLYAPSVAGAGLGWLYFRIRDVARMPRTAIAVVLAPLAMVAIDVARYDPYELSYYNRVVGGLRGAIAAGFEPSYWHESSDWGVFGFLAAQAQPAEDRAMRGVAFFPAGTEARVNFYRWWLLDMGYFDVETGASDDLEALRSRGVRFLVLNNRQGYLAGSRLWRDVDEREPVYVNARDGVMLTAVYDLARRGR